MSEAGIPLDKAGVSLFSVALAAAFLAVVAANAYYFDGAIWMLLNAVLIPIVYVSTKNKKPRTCLNITYALATIFLFGAWVGTLNIQVNYPVRGLNLEVKLFFTFVAMLLCGVYALPLLFPPGEEEEVEKKAADPGHYLDDADKERACSKCKTPSCCFPCCSGCTVFLLILASIHAMALSMEFGIYAPEEGFHIDVGGYNMYARCSGTGSPPVVGFHGYTGTSLDLSWVQRKVSPTTRFCSFDRAGIGLSRELGPEPRTSSQHAQELNKLLEGVNITGDFIAVGHSYAGFNMRTYNAEFPGRMKGMVLIDTVNENNSFPCDPEIEGQYQFGPIFKLGLHIVDLGFLRVAAWTGLINLYAQISDLPADIYYEYVHQLGTYYFKTAGDEFRVWGTSCSNVANLGDNRTLDFPISVIIAEKGIFEDNFTFAEEQADLSQNSTYIFVPEAFHINVLWKEEFAEISANETLRIVEEYRLNN